MLPHTVYLYQKQALVQGDVEVKDVVYSRRTGKVAFTLDNAGSMLARVQDVHAMGGHASVEVAGFPFLPGLRRRVEIDWHEETAPTEIHLQFEHFTVKRPVIVSSD